jgi:hypothetical protein
MSGSFSCDACGKTYAWKPELAGKRVKCKCGKAITIPIDDPAGDDMADLAVPAPARGGGGGGGGGGACPSCGAAVGAGAVICVNCGHNLKTGKKLSTAKQVGGGAAGGGGGAAAAEYAPGYRSYGAVNTSDGGMSDKQKKMVIFSSIAGIAAIIAVLAIVIIPKAMKEKKRLADADAHSSKKMERLITNVESAGGLQEAMRQGTLGQGLEHQDVSAQTKPPYWAIEERHANMLATPNVKVAKKFILGPTSRFNGHDHAQSVKLVNDLYALGCGSVVVISPVMAVDNTEVAGSIVATLPTDKAARTKVFAYYKSLDKTVEPFDLPRQTDMGQKWISIEFKE